MFLDPNALQNDLDRLENIEKASLRFVTQAMELFKQEAVRIFQEERDWEADIGEDITAEALGFSWYVKNCSPSFWQDGLQADALHF